LKGFGERDEGKRDFKGYCFAAVKKESEIIVALS